MFRHSPEARTCTRLCPEWERTRICTVDCPLRHNTYQIQKKRAEEYCYFEDKEQGCTKPFCEFKHRNPDKDAWKLEESQSSFFNEPRNSMAQRSSVDGMQRGQLYDTQFFSNGSSVVQGFSGRYDSFHQSGMVSEQPPSSVGFAAPQEYDLVDSDVAGLRSNGSNALFNDETGGRQDPGNDCKPWLGESTGVPSFGNDKDKNMGVQRSSYAYTRPDFAEVSGLHDGECHDDHQRFRDANNDHKKAKTNGFNVANREKKGIGLMDQSSRSLPKQDASQAVGLKDRTRNKRGERGLANDRSKETRSKSFECLDSDKSFFKKIRMENKTLLNEIEDIERELDEIECRVPHTS